MTRGTNSAGPAGDKGTPGQNVPKSPRGPKTRKSKFRMESEQEKISKSKLRMETREDKLNRARKKLEGKKPPKPRGPVRRVLGAAGWNVHGFVHGKVYEVEHENVGTEGAHRSELVGEAVGRAAVHTAKKRIREHPARAVHKAEAQYIKARADYQFRMAAQENPELAKNVVTRYWHKQKLKKQYAKQARQAAKQTAKQGAKAAGKTAAATEKLAERAVGFVKRHPVGVLLALACAVLLFSLQSCASSLVSLGNAAAGAVGATTYPAEDGDMLGAEAAYCSLEAELRHYLDTYESMKADYERQAAELADVLARLNAERAELANGVDKEHPALVAFAKYQSIETLTREILTDLVDHIKVYENGNISVHFKFADEFRKIAEYIEINTTDTAEAG